MKTRYCDRCGRELPAEYVLHCEECGKCYCPRCAERLALCECSGSLTFFD